MRQLILSISVLLFTFSALAGTETVIVSINKSVPLAEAEATALTLTQYDPSTGTCYFQSELNQYIPFNTCENDPDCPYWGVAIIDLSWECKASETKLKEWMDRVNLDSNFTIYSNGRVGPFPTVSGGN